MKNPRHIVITGASSGIGASLALAYAAPGIRLSLHGRQAERLNRIAEQAEKLGATTTIGLCDVTDSQAMRAWLLSCEALQPIDLVIANAGISAGTGAQGETEEQARSIFSVNLGGVLNTVHPLIQPMCDRRSGQIAIVSSIAGFRGFPGAPAYCGSKAAVRAYGEGLRGELKKFGIAVNVICPGYIKTPMTDVNKFPMPFIMSAERAAQIIQQGLAADRPRIAFPWIMAALVQLLTIAPQRWVDIALQALPYRKPKLSA
jgi:short-subunit dehydrogenase